MWNEQHKVFSVRDQTKKEKKQSLSISISSETTTNNPLNPKSNQPTKKKTNIALTFFCGRNIQSIKRTRRFAKPKMTVRGCFRAPELN